MQSAMINNNLIENEYGYIPTVMPVQQSQNTTEHEMSAEEFEQAVFEQAGNDVDFNVNSINNPLQNPENRAAFEQMIAEEFHLENTYTPELTDISNVSDEVYLPTLLGSGETSEEAYIPTLLGSGETSEEVYTPTLLGSGETSEEAYTPTLLGSGENSEEAYTPTLLGSGETEIVQHSGLLGNSDDHSSDDAHAHSHAENDTNNSVVSVSESSERHHHKENRSNEIVFKNKSKDSSNAIEIEQIKRSSDSDKTVKYSKNKKISKIKKLRTSNNNSLSKTIMESIKENIENNKNNSERILRRSKNDSDNDIKNSPDDYAPKHKDNDMTCQCPTCKNRRFVDRSGDIGVSFKSPQKISPVGSHMVVKSHELEHVSAEYIKAFQEDRRIVSQSVTIYMRNCPDCGARYAAGGVTRTISKLRADVAYKKAMENAKRA